MDRKARSDYSNGITRRVGHDLDLINSVFKRKLFFAIKLILLVWNEQQDLITHVGMLYRA